MFLDRYHKLVHWLKSPFGCVLRKEEQAKLRGIWQTILGDSVVLLGEEIQAELMDDCKLKQHFIVTPDQVSYTKNNLVTAEFEALPLAPDSIDVILLPHTLEFTDDAYQVLREVDIALRPNGYLIVIGFTPLSFWGLRRLFSFRKKAPWCGSFRTPGRIKDWLRLLSFEVVQFDRFLHCPPILHQKLFDKLTFMEKFCKRCLPMLGGGYILVAKKKVQGVTPLRIKWKKHITDMVHRGVVPARREMTDEKAR